MKLSERIRKSMDDAADGLPISWPIDQWGNEVAQLEAESAVLRNTISLLKGENERLANSVEELVVFMLQERERLTEESE